MLYRPLRFVLILSLVAAAASACAGGDDGGGGGGLGDGGDGTGDDGGGDGGDGGDGTGDVNGELRGVLYFDAPYEYVELDLSTSRRLLVRSRGGDVDDDTTPSEDGKEFVATDDPLSGELGATDLLLMDRDGTAVAGFEFFEGLGRPKLSPDGSRIALTLDSVPSVLDRDGQIVASFDQLEDASDMEWTPDGRLLIAHADTIHVVDAALAATQVLADFPGDRPDFLAVSPDGSQLAFDLGDPLTTDNHVFVMNMDGSGLRQLTTSNLNEDAPAWSPDGRFIIVRWGVVTEFGEEISCPELWAVPADATLAFVSGEGSGGAFLVQEISGSSTSNVCAFSPPEWRDVPEPLASSPGTPPAGDGLNAGLDGSLVFRGFVGEAGDGSGFAQVNVADGATRLLPLPPGLDGLDVGFPYVSRDGQELSFIQDEPDSGQLGVEQITIQTLEGKRTAAFEKPDSFAGQPRISPDGQLIAVEWHSIDLGDEGGVPVVTVFDRAGEVRVRWPQTDEWDWLPDGRLLLGDRGTILVSDAALENATEVAALGDHAGGISISPDGTRLAFGMNGHVWTMNIDGTGLRRMTSARLAVHSPAWSPDGRYLAVILEELCPEVYVIPADAERLSIGDPLVESAALRLQQVDDGDQSGICAFSAMTWR